MMIWARWVELYCAAVQELMFGPEAPEHRPTATVISLADERAKRRRLAVRAL
jgi:hypothetical protein